MHELILRAALPLNKHWKQQISIAQFTQLVFIPSVNLHRRT